MKTLISNIKQIVQIENNNEQKINVLGLNMKDLPVLNNAFLIIENGRIANFGEMKFFDFNQQFDNEIKADGKLLMPAWIDSHTHLVHAHTRENEFVDRIKGLSYAEIAEKGGGILNSAKKMSLISENELYDRSAKLLEETMAMGTGAIEIKSGYGLNLENELKMLRVIKRLKDNFPIPIKASFLAAHTYPLEFKENHQGYINEIINVMLPKVAEENLADYIDVFCETGFFSVDETSQILEAASNYNLKPKIHANQLNKSGGVQIGIKHQAVSVDHLESMGNEEIEALINSKTIPTLLPGAAFFLGMHYQPARALIDANLPVCLASDFNPGSCPSANMNFIASLACTQMKMTPEEAINSMTINAAAALNLSHEIGTIKVGKKANLMLTKKIDNYALLPYSFGNHLIEKLILA